MKRLKKRVLMQRVPFLAHKNRWRNLDTPCLPGSGTSSWPGPRLSSRGSAATIWPICLLALITSWSRPAPFAASLGPLASATLTLTEPVGAGAPVSECPRKACCSSATPAHLHYLQVLRQVIQIASPVGGQVSSQLEVKQVPPSYLPVRGRDQARQADLL